MTEETWKHMPPVNLPKPCGLQVRRERRDAVEHRQRILQVAQALFAQQGVEAVSMHQIAKAASIGQGTLYRHYAHKGELCMALMGEHHEVFVTEITTFLAHQARTSPLERLDGVLARSITFLEEQGALLQPIMQTQMQQVMCGDAAKASRMSFYLWLHDLLADLLTEAVTAGTIASLDVSFTADALLATLNPMFYRLQRQERGLSPERILQGLRHIYIDGIKW